MKSSDREAFKAMLLEQRAALLHVASSGEEAAQTVELDQARVGRLSRMDALRAQAMAKESARRRQLALTRIGAALDRLESGDYGYCLGCGEDIPVKRLEVDPAATLCIDCADSAERDAT